LTKDDDGIIVGMLGHKLGEQAALMNEPDGKWGKWALGRAYEGELPTKISGFTSYSYEYDNENRLQGIRVSGRIGSNRSRENIQELQQEMCDILEQDYGLSFTRSSGSFDDNTVFDSYHDILEEGSDGWPKRQIDLCVVPQEAGGAVMYLELSKSSFGQQDDNTRPSVQNSEGRECSVQLDGLYFGLKWNQNINCLPDELFQTDKAGRRILFRDKGGKLSHVVYKPSRRQLWLLAAMKTKEVRIAITDGGEIKAMWCCDSWTENDWSDGEAAKDYVSRLSKRVEESYREFKKVLSFFQNSREWSEKSGGGWVTDDKQEYSFETKDGVMAEVQLFTAKNHIRLSVAFIGE